MTEFHPPMTGLDTHFEDELDPKGSGKYKQAEEAMKAEDRSPKPSRENADDRRAEEAMHLGQ